MKYLKYFESITDEDKKMGFFVDFIDILQVYNYLNEKEIKFITLFGNDDDSDDYYFLILIEGEDYKKLQSVDEMGFKDYYIKIYDTEGFSDNVFTNWFIPEELKGEWKIINDIEEVKIIIDTKKYNL